MISIEEIRRTLKESQARDFPSMRDQFVPAAVLAPLLEEADGIKLLFTRRTKNLKHHSGEISFPGGRLDDSDQSMLDCALRETKEEIGLPSEQIEILGRLDETPVISGHLVTPFVGRIKPPFKYTPSPEEIDYIFTVNIKEFLNPAVHRMKINDFMDRKIPIHFYDVAGECVWGATGRIVTNLLSTCFDYRPPAYQAFLREHNDPLMGEWSKEDLTS